MAATHCLRLIQTTTGNYGSNCHGLHAQSTKVRSLSLSSSSITAARERESYMNYLRSTSYNRLLNLLLRSFRDADNPYMLLLLLLLQLFTCYILCLFPLAKGQVKLVPRTRPDYSNKSSHVNVRKMLRDQPTKRWKNPTSLSKFPPPSPPRLFSKKKNPKQELSSYLESKRAARYSK